MRPETVARLQVRSPRSAEIEVGEELRIGRTPGACDYVIDHDHQISRIHARIFREGPSYFLVDENSRNGTFLNGRRIKSRMQLKDSDVIEIGQSRLVFRLEPKTGLSQPGARHEGDTILATLDADRERFALGADSQDVDQIKKVPRGRFGRNGVETAP